MRYQLPRTKKILRRVFTWRESFEWDAGFLPDWTQGYDEYMPIVPDEQDKGFCRLIAHDALEHIGLGVVTCNPCAEELIALGSTMQGRRHDFYNLMGDDGLGSEVAQQLQGLLNFDEDTPMYQQKKDFLRVYSDRPTYYSDDVWVELEYAWNDIESHLLSEYDQTWKEVIGKGKITKHRLLRLACAWISTGYIRAERIDARYGNYRFARGFDRLRRLAKEAAWTLEALSDYDCRIITEVNFAESSAKLKIDVDYYDAELSYLKDEYRLVYKDGY